MSESKSRLERKGQQEARKAQKLLQKLKQMQGKRKMLEASPKMSETLHQSPSQREESFRTCVNSQQQNLAELYFKIFNEHMVDPPNGAAELQTCLLNMRKQIIRLNQDIEDKTISRSILTKQLDSFKAESKLTEQQLRQDLNTMEKQLEQQRQKYLELLTSADPQNTSVLNATVLCEGYEDKIRELSSGLEEKQAEARQSRLKIVSMQSQIDELKNDKKTNERESEKKDIEIKNLVDLVEKLSLEMSAKFENLVSEAPQVVQTIDLEETKKEYQAKIKEMNNHFQAEIRTLTQERNKLKVQADRQLQDIMNLNRTMQREREQNMQRVESEINDSQQRQRNLQHRINTLTQEKQEIQKQLQNLTSKLAALQQKLQTQEGLKREKQSNQKQNFEVAKSNYEQMLAEYKQKCQSLQGLLKEQKAINKENSDKMSEVMKSHQRRIQELDSGKIKQLKLLTDKYESSIKNLEAERDKHICDNKLMLEQNKAIRQESKQLQNQVEELKQAEQELEHRLFVTKQENKQLISERQKIRITIGEMQKKIDKLQNDLREQRQQLRDRMQQTGDENQKQIHQLTEALKQTQDQKEKLQSEKANLVHEHEKQKNNLQDLIKALKVKNKTLQQENVSISKKLKQLQAEITSKSKELKKLKAATSQALEPKSDQRESSNDEQIIILKKKINMLEDEKQQLESELTEVRETLEQVQMVKAMESTKYIQAIEHLTKQLNEAYSKCNEQVNALQQKTAQATTRKRDLNTSKQKRDNSGRKRSVNKLKSYFGFGGGNNQ